MKVNFGNVATMLLIGLICGIAGLTYGYLVGREDINNRLVVSSYNSGYSTGYITGGADTLSTIFKDDFEKYKW